MASLRVSVATVLSSFLLLALSATPAAAQAGAIAGTVRDASGGSTLSSVRVQVLEEEAPIATTTTGPGGAYRISEVPAGSYTVAFVLPGWETLRRSGVTVRSGETATLSVVLTPRAYNLNPITVTTSRQEQKLLDAPAMVAVVETEEVESRPALTHLDLVEGKAGIDVIKTGLQQGYVVARGFNNIFSGSMLTMTDYRIARVPSLRANIPHLDPTTTADLSRIELVLGPASALYGPNAAQGVLHKITKSPIDDPGSTVSVAGGLRQQDVVPAALNPSAEGFPATEEGVFFGEARIAHRVSDEFGFDLSGEYFTGRDYLFLDAAEEENEQFASGCLGAYSLANPACLIFAPTGAGGEPVLPDRDRLERIARRDFDLRRWTFSADAEWRPSDDANVVFSYGRTQAATSIDLTGIGAAQVDDWAYQYVQTRFSAGDLFGQAYFNWSDAGDTYILQTGQPIADESFIAVGQLQHAAELGDDQRFVYGADFIHTEPKTNGSINGVHEDEDAFNEVGVYLQSETSLSERWELTLAARADYHSVLDEMIFSPRGALVYKPSEAHSIRGSFNRAFATPDNNNLFLDILARRIPLGESGFSYALNAQGTTDRGFSFVTDQGGRPMMKSPFTPAEMGGPDQFLPARTSVLWQFALGALAAQSPTLAGQVAQMDPPSEADVPTVLATLNTGTGSFEPVPGGFGSLGDIPPIQEEITNTVELGYKGLVGDRLLLSLAGYWTRIEDYIGPLRIETPNAFLSSTRVFQYLVANGMSAGNAEAATAVMAGTPLGVVQPAEVAEPGASLLLTYRNVGDVELFGGDLSATYQITDEWELGLATSVVEDDVFFTDGGERVELNAPDFKARLSAGYDSEGPGFEARTQWRFVNGFPAASGVYVGQVPDYDVLDLTLGYTFPGVREMSVQLDVQNVLDEDYRAFPGAPTLGRFTLARVRYKF